MNQSLQTPDLFKKIRENQRISASEALFLWQEASWLELGQLAQERRAEVIGEDWASYTMFQIINYTNVCNVDCSFCSFKRHTGEPRAYVMTLDQVLEKTAEAQAMGADQIFLQGGVNPDLTLDYYLGLLQGIKKEFGFQIRAFSPVELREMALVSGLSLKEVVKELKAAGLDSVPGAGAEILADRVRQVLSPKKCTAQEWADILALCHQEGLGGSANIVIGSVETDSEMIEHLELVRQLQDKTGGFSSFIPWTFQPQTKDFKVKKIPHHQYLKLLSLCRLFLDNIKNIEVSVMVLGTEIGKLALHLGANDISSPVLEENVLRSFGVPDEAGAKNLIAQADLQARRRDFDYRHWS